MPQPLVTVITPTYNCGNFIKETVESVLKQDYPNVDHLVINDASLDGSEKILEEFIAKIRIWNEPINQGEAKVVNMGLKDVVNVRAKYFFILNGDDKLLPGAISKLVDYMESHPDILCAYPDWDSIDEEGQVRRHVKTREYDFSYWVRHNTWPMSVGTIFRSDVIQKVGYWDESFKYLSDADYWLRIGLVGPMARYPETLACWRKRNGQASSQKNQLRASEHVRVMTKFFNLDKAHYWAWLCMDEAMCWANLVAAAVTGSKSETVGYIWKAIKAYPQVLFKLEFWDTLYQRTRHYFRR